MNEELKNNQSFEEFKPSAMLHRQILWVRHQIVDELVWYRRKAQHPAYFLKNVLPEIYQMFLLIRSDFAEEPTEDARIDRILQSKNIPAILKVYTEMENWLRSKNITTIYVSNDGFKG